jgi:hypothetical protein
MRELLSRVLTRKLNRRLARLTLEQRGFWSGAFADAMEAPTTKGFSSSAQESMAIQGAEQKAWEKLYKRWPELADTE